MSAEADEIVAGKRTPSVNSVQIAAFNMVTLAHSFSADAAEWREATLIQHDALVELVSEKAVLAN
jgi:hypothetical protein